MTKNWQKDFKKQFPHSCWKCENIENFIINLLEKQKKEIISTIRKSRTVDELRYLSEGMKEREIREQAIIDIINK